MSETIKDYIEIFCYEALVFILGYSVGQYFTIRKYLKKLKELEAYVMRELMKRGL